MKQWEYNQVIEQRFSTGRAMTFFEDENGEGSQYDGFAFQAIRDYGRRGWELIAVAPGRSLQGDDETQFWFKRLLSVSGLTRQG